MAQSNPAVLGPVESSVRPLPCPFCGRQPDVEDGDTLYPSGGAWRQDGEIRSYHSYRNLPREQWCYTMHCNESAGGCGAEISGDSEDEALAKWNRRPNAKLTGPSAGHGGTDEN